MSDKNKLATGAIILAAGIIILLGKWGVFSFLGSTLWPLLILIPGILLHLLYASRRLPAGSLILGGTLVVYGLLFFIGNFGGWGTFRYIWPGFILGIAIGLFEYDMMSQVRQPGIFTMALGLLVVSVVLFGLTLFHVSLVYLLALVLIIGGLGLIGLRGMNHRRW